MKKHVLFIKNSFFFLMLFTATPSFADNLNTVKNYLDIPDKHIMLECPQETFHITNENTLKICLDRFDDKKRCEITISPLPRYPAENNISFSFKLSGDFEDDDYHFSLMQIHNRPDKGENWRCPPYTFDMKSGKLNIYNRWDKESLSVTTGYHCTEPGSTIQSRSLLKNKRIKADTWYPLSFSSKFNYEKNGRTKIIFGEHTKEEEGPNIYNDKRPPYLKLGIYKPTSWGREQKQICVEYKDLKINTLNNKSK